MGIKSTLVHLPGYGIRSRWNDSLGPAAGQTYAQKVIATGPIAYWIMGEAAGLVSIDQINSPSQDGAYTGVTLGQAGIGDGNTCPLFDGSNDYNNIYTATFIAAFSGSAGTISVWARVSGAGVWTDGTGRRIMSLRVDANNEVFIARDTTNNQISFHYDAGGTAKQVTLGSVSTTGWIHLAITWDKTADQFKAYYGGSQTGSTQTGLGVWAGSLSALSTLIGAIITTPVGVWDGYLAHAAVWTSALTGAQIATLATV